MCIETNRETVTLSDAGWSEVNKTSSSLAYLSLTFEHLNVGLLSHRQNQAEKYLKQLGILESPIWAHSTCSKLPVHESLRKAGGGGGGDDGGSGGGGDGGW